MTNPFPLTIEQEFNVRSFRSQIEGMNREQALEFLVELYSNFIWQEATYKKLLARRWGIETPSESIHNY